MTIKPGWSGRVYEDFEVGDVYQHPLGLVQTPGGQKHFALHPGNARQRISVLGDQRAPFLGGRADAKKATCRIRRRGSLLAREASFGFHTLELPRLLRFLKIRDTSRCKVACLIPRSRRGRR